MNCISELPKDLKNVHLHFVGIKGTGMAALVEILFHNGAIITGSDVSERFYTDAILEKLNIKVLPFSEKNITKEIDYVIYSSAYKLDKNPDLIEAVKQNIPTLLYTQALGSYSSKSFSCGICGVHGKTSTTGLAGSIMKQLSLPSQVLAGSVINSFGDKCTYTSQSFDSGVNASESKNIFIAETCEYQRHFMSFCPQKIILTSVESDHQDFYPTYESIRDAFVDYVLKLPANGDLIYCADDKGACEVRNLVQEKRNDINFISYGENAEGDFKLTFGETENEEQKFNIKSLGDFALKFPGKHEVLDAAAAIVLSVRLLMQYNQNVENNIENIRKGLLSFTGGKRRSELKGHFVTGSKNDVIVIDDYGHHPTAIKTTLEGYKKFYKGRRIIVDFMSHTYSRTQNLLNEFASCFTSCDTLILHKIYASARENINDFSITGKTLFEEAKKYHNDVHYFEEILDAKNFVLEEINKTSGDFPNGILFVTMGAGDNWKLGEAILEANK